MRSTYIKGEERHVSFTIVVKVTVRFVIFIRHVSKTIIVLRKRQIKIKNHADTYVILCTTAASNHV